MAENTAFRNNALPYPVYGVPWTIVFPLLDADGDPVTGATCDSEVSINGETGGDCTNEGTEITFTTATNKGQYYLTLTAAEMTADIVTVSIYSATSKATVVVLYPRKLVVLATGTSQGGAAGYITLAASTILYNNQYNGCLCVGVLDTLIEARILQACTASNQQCTVTPGWNTAPDSNDTYTIYLPEGMQIPTVNVIDWINAAAAAMTGDAYARLGAPAGASVSADVAAVKSDSGATKTTTDKMVFTVANQIDANAKTVGDKTGYALSVTPPTAIQIQAEMEENGASILDTLRDDLADGGRLDLLIDAIKAVTDAESGVKAVVNNIHDTDLPAVKTDTGNLVTDVAATHVHAAGAETQATAAVAAIGVVDGIVDDILVDTGTTLDGIVDDILADTNELELDWKNGGRLDVILDAASAPSAATVADAVWDEDIVAAHTTADTAGKLLAGAGAGADPWDIALPGAYAAGKAGYILGTNLDANIADVETKVDALNDISVADIIAGVADGANDLQEMLRLITAACVGKSSGGGSSTIKFRNTADTKDRITATVDAVGNRTAVLVDAS